ncbi:hypothetical protein BJ508DRAFT_367651 [Ascobolus immersus RN42]|uniref:Uncharacterized protein n=1 Tax=Ascobolus immersus RN42 TaxID=1160509 RepID=A0A3N4HFL2_ASCIM|nr:hypothetical protein BJ508DRAFT_367651 [Ascobolus immersus RN42]
MSPPGTDNESQQTFNASSFVEDKLRKVIVTVKDSMQHTARQHIEEVPAHTRPKANRSRRFADVLQPPPHTSTPAVTTRRGPAPTVTAPEATPPPATPTKRARRVVVQATTPIKTDPLAIRDAINKALKAANAPGYLLIRSVTVNSKGNALLTVLEGGTSADLVKFSQHVAKALGSIGITTTRIEPDNRWFKLLVHGVSVVDFGKEQGMEYLRDEINRFNPKVQLASLPRWLLSDDRREGKAYSSVVIAVRTQEEQNLANKGLLAMFGKPARTLHTASTVPALIFPPNTPARLAT